MTASTSLVARAQSVAELERALLESGGELTPEIEAMLAVVESTLSQKVDSYKSIIDRIDDAGKYYADKAKQYQVAARGCARAVDRLKDNLKAAMHTLNAKTISGNEFQFTLSAMAPKLVISGDVAEEYQTRIVEVKPDAERIRFDLENGIDLNWAKLEPVFALRGGIKKILK